MTRANASPPINAGDAVRQAILRLPAEQPFRSCELQSCARADLLPGILSKPLKSDGPAELSRYASSVGNSIRVQIRQHVETHFPPGQPFARSEFTAFGPCRSVTNALAKLVHQGWITTVSRGVYLRPQEGQVPDAAAVTLLMTASSAVRQYIGQVLPAKKLFLASALSGLDLPILQHLARTGWLTRVTRGAYLRLPAAADGTVTISAVSISAAELA